MASPIKAGVGWSAQADAEQAGRAAAAQAQAQRSEQPAGLAVVMASSWFNQAAVLTGVTSALPSVPVIGASTAGEITPEGPSSHSCVVLLVGSPDLACSLGVGEQVDRNPREAGQRAARAALEHFQGPDRQAFLMFGDGLVTGHVDTMRGIQEAVGTSSLIVGGLAGDDLRFVQTAQYAGGRALTRSVVGALLGGAVRFGIGFEHGFAPISKPRHITRARANVLMELDHQPAASVYEEYFGPDLVRVMRQEGFSRRGIAYPLGIQSDVSDRWLLRNVVSFDDRGSLSCNAEIAEGSWLQLMLGSRDLALEAARRAAQQAVEPLKEVAAVLVFDSVLRRTLLGQSYAARELQEIRQAIGASVPMAGCYTYGEAGPLATAPAYGTLALQTGSVLVVAIGT